MKTEQRHISRLRVGDTVIHQDEVITVCKSDLKRDAFMGMTFRGDSYRSGTQPARVVVQFEVGDTL